MRRTRSAKKQPQGAVSLRPRARALVARLIPIAKGCKSTAIAGLTPEEITILKRCLRRVYVNMKSRPTGARGDADGRAASSTAGARPGSRPRQGGNNRGGANFHRGPKEGKRGLTSCRRAQRSAGVPQETIPQ